MDKTAIKNYAIFARNKLRQSTIDMAATIGVYEDKVEEPISKGNDFAIFKNNIGIEKTLDKKELNQRQNLINEISKKGFNQVIEEIAYTWFNRLIAIRFMEVNDYLPSRTRVLSSVTVGRTETDVMLDPFNSDLDFSQEERDFVISFQDSNAHNDLFKLLFIKQCNKLNEILPGLFEKTLDYSELLFNVNLTDQDDVVYRLVNEIPESNFDIAQEGQVEIIGWLYQYYNTEPKEVVNKKKSLNKNDIPAKTQLFTPDWIVKYMVENSLGRLWLDGHSSSKIKDTWKYYLDEAQQEPDVITQLEIIRNNASLINPQDIKLIDPSMGSGHILVYAFDVFMQIYLDSGYSERDASELILTHNIYGLDIDDRAYQLAYFALMMKARQYNRRILTKGVTPHVYSIVESNNIDSNILSNLGKYESLANEVYDFFYNAKEYGSLLEANFSITELFELSTYLESDTMNSQISIFDINIKYLKPLVLQAIVLSQKYDVVVTNPPYMAPTSVQKEFVTKYYPNSKTDLFAVFIERCLKFTKENGLSSLVTMQAWMFLSSYEKMRKNLINTYTITNLMQMNNMVMGIAFGTAVSIIRNSNLGEYKGTYNYVKYENIKNDIPDSFPIINNRFAQIASSNYSKIPGSPIAYWATKSVFENYKQGILLGDKFQPRQGLAAGKVSYFYRQWFEVFFNSIGFNFKNNEDFLNSNYKYAPVNKGGGIRNYYGNNYEVIKYDKKNYKLLLTSGNHLPSRDKYFLEGITWSKISSSSFSCRYCQTGYVFTDAGMKITSKNSIYNLGALMSSKVFSYLISFLSETLNFETGNISRFPIIEAIDNNDKIKSIYCSNINYSKLDWNSFEISWDFKVHPLVKYSASVWVATNVDANIQNYYGHHIETSCPLETSFLLWQGECNERFNQLKSNEEELNRIFIDIYRLQDELTPEVEDKNVTVRKADLQRDIKSLISYAVGCMFGRYSLNAEGLTYAGGEWNSSKYSSFIPDDDNIIPICDEEYFNDDIVGRFIEFIKTVYGENTLEENLTFIANALGGKGTSREKIRNYFLNSFYKDHCKIYQKRPIYWLFDSGKQNGFKALIYMHRYNEDTLGKIRTEYLHKIQNIYEEGLLSNDYTIENSTNNTEISKARKHKEKLIKQLEETKKYDYALANKASKRIHIDLDDGVKHNYELFQDVEVVNEGSKTIKVDLLAKIK